MAKPVVQAPIATARPFWSRHVQWALAFFLGVSATLIVGRIISFHALRPTERDNVPPLQSIELNRANKSELLQLPGIGEHLADAIITARDERGGFRQVDDLREVKGIGPMRLEHIRPYVRVEWGNTTMVSGSLADPAAEKNANKGRSSPSKKNPSSNQRIDINRASAAELQRLPGIGPVMSQRIIQEREKTPFRSVDDLRHVSGIGAKTLEKIRPFVTVGEMGAEVASKSE